LFKLRRQNRPIHKGHVYIEQNYVGRIDLYFFKGFQAVSGGADLVALIFKSIKHHLAQIAIIFNNQ